MGGMLERIQSGPWRLRALITSMGLVVVLVALLTRTIGIHIDENNYLAWAASVPLGDVLETGKPYVFYLLNYGIWHGVPRWTGSLRPLSLHLSYAALSVMSIGWLAAKAATTTESFVWHFVILLCAPFFIFNSTQVMMESALLPMLTLTLAGVVDLDRNGPSWRASLLMLASATSALLIKETAVPALLIVLVAFWPLVGKRLWPVAVALVIGFGVTAVMMSAVHAPPHRYGGVSSFLDLGAVWSRLKLTKTFAWMWIFYVSPFTLGAVLFLYVVRGMFRSRYERALLRLGALSLLATFGVQLASNMIYARYAYPVVWVGLIALAFLLVRGPRRLAAISIALYCLPIASMWAANSNRWSLWPSLVADEAYYSGYTILPGVPNLGWLAFAGERRKDMCIFVPEQGTEKPEVIRRYFETVTVHPRFFDETQFDEFQQCQGPKAIVRRQYQATPALCQPECPKTQYSISACALQEMRTWATREREMLTNRTCLP